MKTRNIVAAAVAVIVVVGALLATGIAIGTHISAPRTPPATGDADSRDFMFQVVGVETPNQGGHSLNLFFHYRYSSGITDEELPDYRDLRDGALAYLKTVDVSTNPYWEVLNHDLCTRLKSSYPLQAISCEMQVVGTGNSREIGGPGYRASIETIGDIEPLALPGTSQLAGR